MSYFHVMIWPRDPDQQRLGEIYGMNLSEEELRERIVTRYDEGRPITWSGRTIAPDGIANITITSTLSPLSYPRFQEYDALKTGEDITNEWITGPPGIASQSQEEMRASGAKRDPRRVMVVHGQNMDAQAAMFAFLRSLSLQPVEWEQAIAATGMGSPHNLEAVRAAMDLAQAVVVIFTAEDQAGLLPDLTTPADDDVLLRGQPRQNVTLEAGMAMGIDPAGTILVELGDVRHTSDFAGLNVVRLTNDPQRRAALRTRLRTAGCNVDDSGTDWTTLESGGDFEACLVPWQAQAPPQLRTE